MTERTWRRFRFRARPKGVLNVLFAGPAGTGKTLAAEIIAGALGLDPYKIDLSTIVSKYIGDTGNNLSRIFGEAVSSNTILSFDGADALLEKRSEVRDARDRYANIETSYRLQKTEESAGATWTKPSCADGPSGGIVPWPSPRRSTAGTSGA